MLEPRAPREIRGPPGWPVRSPRPSAKRSYVLTVRSVSVPLSAARHAFVQQYSDLVYSRSRGGHLVPGGQKLHFDFLKPLSRTPTPLVVFIKGGGFRNVHWARYLPALVDLAQRGIAVASVEYRTSNVIRLPGPVDDVREAIRFPRARPSSMLTRKPWDFG